jgi:hypothetical protein
MLTGGLIQGHHPAMPLLAFADDCDFATYSSYVEVKSVFHDLGLPFEDSFWLFDPAGSDLALCKGSLQEKGAYHDELLAEISAGRLTMLHAGANLDQGAPVGDFRDKLAQGLAYLQEHARVPRIWTNHGDAHKRQNLSYGPGGYHGGDRPADDYYCLDLLQHFGLEFFWTDADYDNDNFRLDPVWRVARAENGSEIKRFRRFRGPLPKAPDAESLAWQLREEHLAQLVREGGATILYQHWHIRRRADGAPYPAAGPVFPPASLRRLEALARLHAEGCLQVWPLKKILERGPA